MEPSEWSWKHECQIESRLDVGHVLIDRVMDELRCHHWPDKAQFAVQLAMEEAIVNAITHGNKSDPTKHVKFSCFVNGKRMRVSIEDEGEGFRPTALPDATDEDHICVPSGRGVLLIRGFMSTVEFNETGNRIVMEKVLG